MRVMLAAVVVLVLVVGGLLNPLAWLNAAPVMVAMAVLPRAAGVKRTAAVAFAAVLAGFIAAFHIAWHLDVGRVAAGSSTAGVAFAFIPFVASFAGAAAAAVAAGVHVAWRSAGLRPLARPVAVAAFIVLLIGSGGAFMAQVASAPTWPEPGVLLAAPGLQRELVLDTYVPGRIRWIGEVPRAGGSVIAVAGQTGVELLDGALQPLGRVATTSATGPARMGLRPTLVTDAGADSLLVLRGGGGYGAVRLQQLDGTPVWDFEEATGDKPSSAIVVPRTDGRMLRYVVTGRHGVYGYDEAFTELWRVAANAADISQADLDGRLTLLARFTTGGGMLLDEHGTPTGALPARPRLGFAKVIAWRGEPVIVAEVSDRLAVLDAGGRVLHTWDLEPVGRSPVVATASFGLPGDPHLAVLASSSSGIGRAVLTLIDAGGAVVHREVVVASSGLHAVRWPDGDVLLFGDGHTRVWSLSARTVR
jgi:hypothetical protein